jgi:hypothetical protein
MSKKLKERIVHVVKVDSDAIAKGWGLTKSELEGEYKDGRTASPLTERLATRIYNLTKAESSCQEGYDATEGNEEEAPKTEFKVLTDNGVKFQRSSRIGTGRDKKADGKPLSKQQKKNHLLTDIGRVESYVVSDITSFPTIRVVRVASGFVAGLVEKKLLTPSGIDKATFEKSLREEDEEGKPTCELKEIHHDFTSKEVTTTQIQGEIMQQPGLNGRHRDKDGEADHKRKDTHLSTLRETYGDSLLPNLRGDTHLGTILSDNNVETLDELLRKLGKK